MEDEAHDSVEVEIRRSPEEIERFQIAVLNARIKTRRLAREAAKFTRFFMGPTRPPRRDPFASRRTTL